MTTITLWLVIVEMELHVITAMSIMTSASTTLVVLIIVVMLPVVVVIIHHSIIRIVMITTPTSVIRLKVVSGVVICRA